MQEKKDVVKKMKQLFKNVGSFMIRTPSLPIDLLVDNIKNSNNIKIDNAMLLSDSSYKDQFNEAIFVASHDLYESMQRYTNGDKIRNTDYLLNSVYKYFSRSCSRCTPFGLFSTVAFGDITSEKTSFKLSATELNRKPLVDSNWLFEVVYMYESRYLKSLKYKINESVAVYRNKANLFNCTQNNNSEKINKKSVNYSKAFEIVLEASNDYVSYSEIIENLKKSYPNLDEGTFHTYIQSLIKEGYLISDLRPPLTITNQLEYFICKLMEYDINIDTFVDIKEQIENYSSANEDEKINCLMNIFNKMEAVYKSKNYIAIDSSFDYKECNLNINEIKNIDKLINLFIQFNVNEPFDILKEYKDNFLGRYGLSRCVPLIELIDNDTGLGLPSHYDRKTNANNFGGYINPWVKLFERKYIDAIKLNNEIEITDTDMRMLLSENFETNRLPKTMEIYFNHIKENGKDVFQLSNIFGSTYAGKSFGRFSHFMDNPKSFYEKVNKAYGNDDECQFCEFVFLPDSLYTANVIRNMNGSTYEMSFGTSNSKENTCKLKLSDILVGFENNKLYLKSAINNKRIVPTSTNMFNPQLKPKILRLIDDISSDGIRFYNKPWQYLFETFGYLPTIRYKNFILEQEKWSLKIDDLGLAKRYNFDEFKKGFSEYIKSRNIPIWVNIVDADKKLLLNLKKDRCLAVLQKSLEKSEIVLERYNADAEHPVKYNGSSYCCELVIPLMLDEEVYLSKNNDTKVVQICSDDRIKEPLDEWLYFKIYGIEENIDYLLGEALFIPLQELLKNKEIDSYFFIQYKDPDKHLRLRLKADKDKLLVVQLKMFDIFSQFMKKSIILKYSIDCYELELERYGGYDLMDYAHEVFYKDSMATQSIIREKNNHNTEISDELLALVIIFFHMTKFNLSLEEMYVFLECDRNIKQNQEEFKKSRDTYVEFAINYLSGKKVTLEEEFILNILSVKNDSMEIYLNGIKEFYPNDKAIKLSILNSLLHMSMNRLFGPNTDLERKMRNLARHTYYSTYNRNKKTGILDGKKNEKI
ncbi:lantibiotic dehydratase [Faecalimicrobium sp. JNUCC 81]